jgi:hypothetical protein
LGEEYRSLSTALRSFLRFPLTSSLTGPKYLPQYLFLITLNLCSSFNVRDEASHPFKTTEKITVLYILIFVFLDSKLKNSPSEVKRIIIRTAGPVPVPWSCSKKEGEGGNNYVNWPCRPTISVNNKRSNGGSISENFSTKITCNSTGGFVEGTDREVIRSAWATCRQVDNPEFTVSQPDVVRSPITFLTSSLPRILSSERNVVSPLLSWRLSQRLLSKHRQI